MATKSKNTFCNVLISFMDNLELVAKQLEDEDTCRRENESFQFEMASFWDRLLQTVKAVSNEITKLSMMLSKPPTPDPEHCSAMITRVQGAVLSMVSAFYSLPKSQGVRLRRCVKKAVLNVVQSIISFAGTLKDGGMGSPDQLKSTGCVWQNTDAFSSLPRDNQAVVLGVLRDTSGLVRDAAEEIQEAVDDGEGGDYNGDDILSSTDNSERWSDADKAVVGACLGLVKVSRSTLKKVTGRVKQPGVCDNGSAVTQLDELADQVDRLSPLVDDLVSGLYPPVSCPDTHQQATLVADNLKTCLLFLRQSELTGEDDAEWLEFLLSATQHNMEKITTVTSDGSAG